jgi:phage tail-like protein
MAETATRDDPFQAFNFVVEIGSMRAGFSEVGGLTTETDVIEYREGNTENTVKKLPGLKKFTNINLKRGFTTNRELYEWRKKVMQGKTERMNGTITLRNEAGDKALVWQFFQAFPTKWSGPAMNAKNNEVAIEEMEICVEGLELEA